jgi:hypothetical protein
LETHHQPGPRAFIKEREKKKRERKVTFFKKKRELDPFSSALVPPSLLISRWDRDTAQLRAK